MDASELVAQIKKEELAEEALLKEFRESARTLAVHGEHRSQLAGLMSSFDREYSDMVRLRVENFELTHEFNMRQRARTEAESISLEELKYDNLALEEKIANLTGAIQRAKKNVERIERKKSNSPKVQSMIEKVDVGYLQNHLEALIRESSQLSVKLNEAKKEKANLLLRKKVSSDQLREFFEKTNNNIATMKDDIRLLSEYTV